MDAIPALNVAGGILAVVACSTELASTSNKSQAQLSLDEKEYHSILETLRIRRLTLSTLDRSVEQQLSTGASQPSSDMLALHSLALSCLKESGSLLKELEDELRNISREEGANVWTDRKDLSRSVVEGRFDEKKVEWLSSAVTVHVSSIIRCESRLIGIGELTGINIRC